MHLIRALRTGLARLADPAFSPMQWRRWLTAFTLFIALGVTAACTERDVAGSLILAAQTGEAVTDTTKVLLAEDAISIKQACVVDQYGGLFEAALRKAWTAFVSGAPREDVLDIIDGALDIINGVSEEARKLAEDACAGEPG